MYILNIYVCITYKIYVLYLNVYVYDLCTFNNDECESNYNGIYLDELELKKENENPYKASFLDLLLEAHDMSFTAKLLDERDAFPFSISCLSHVLS